MFSELFHVLFILSSITGFSVNAEPSNISEAWNRLENFTRFSVNDFINKYQTDSVRILEMSKVSEDCQRSIDSFVEGLKSMKIEALKQLDSWGRFPSGVLDGSWTDFGAFHQCLELESAQYCFMFSKMPLMAANNLEGWHRPIENNYFNFSSETFGYLQNYAHLFRYLNITTGLCVPRACSPLEIKEIATQAHQYYQTGFQVDVDLCQVRRSYVPIEFREIIAGIIVATVIGLNIAGSITSKYKFLQHFNFIENWKRLFKPRSADAIIPCLDGIKSITMGFMILVHIFFLILFPKFVSQFRLLETTSKPLILLFFLGPFTVDTFFLITGLEMTIQFTVLRRRFQLIPYLVLRYIRFVPVIGWTICCYILLFSDHVRNYLGGPFWSFFKASGTVPEKCAKKWPLHLVLLAHYFNVGEDSQLCLLADWYLEADYLFAVLFLLVLIPYLKSKPFWSCLVTLFFIFFGCVMIGFVMHYQHVQHTWQPLMYQNQGFIRYLAFIHGKPWGHISPYFFGVLLGFNLYDPIKTSQIKSTAIWIFWLLCWIVLLIYESGINFNLFPIPYLVSLAYGMFSKVIWSTIIAWLIFACHNGHIHQWIPKFLSSHGFTVLSRINLSVLFVNLLVVRLRNATLQTNIFPTLSEIIYAEVIPLSVVTYGVSFLFCVLVEGPTINIIKYMISGSRKDIQESKKQAEHGNL